MKIYTKAHIFITTVKTLGLSRRIETNWEAERWMLSLRSSGAEDGTYLRDTSPWFSFNLHLWKITLYIRNYLKFLLYPLQQRDVPPGVHVPQVGNHWLFLVSFLFPVAALIQFVSFIINFGSWFQIWLKLRIQKVIFISVW